MVLIFSKPNRFDISSNSVKIESIRSSNSSGSSPSDISVKLAISRNSTQTPVNLSSTFFSPWSSRAITAGGRIFSKIADRSAATMRSSSNSFSCKSFTLSVSSSCTCFLTSALNKAFSMATCDLK